MAVEAYEPVEGIANKEDLPVVWVLLDIARWDHVGAHIGVLDAMVELQGDDEPVLQRGAAALRAEECDKLLVVVYGSIMHHAVVF
jgi:hypothetical protein